MMNLLIVDDEYYYAQGLKEILENSNLQLGSIECAYSMKEAQTYLLKEKVHILISDIEMPQGTGLELVNWLITQGYDTQTIFLTAYANFDYALGALKLKSSDYLLKPVDKETLIQGVKKAIQAYNMTQMNSQLETTIKDNTTKDFNEQFWYSLSTGVIEATPESIRHNMKQYGMDMSLFNDQYYCALLQISLKTTDERWENSLFDYAVRNVTEETLSQHGGSVSMTQLNSREYFIILSKRIINDYDNFRMSSSKLTENLKKSLPGTYQLFIHPSNDLLNIHKVYTQLAYYAHNHIHRRHNVIDLSPNNSQKKAASTIPTSSWVELMLQKKFNSVEVAAHQYLSELRVNLHANRNDLIRFKHDFMQVLYAILEKKGESAHILFKDNNSITILEAPCEDIDSMFNWVDKTIELFKGLLDTLDESASSIKIIKDYINDNLDKDLNRSLLASVAFISPDYLSHIFKEETGESLSGYILAMRLKKAKELLVISQDSVRDVAIKNGFPNISYFSNQFKRMTGSTPLEYRKDHM